MGGKWDRFYSSHRSLQSLAVNVVSRSSRMAVVRGFSSDYAMTMSFTAEAELPVQELEEQAVPAKHGFPFPSLPHG